MSLIDDALKRAQEASRRQGEPERARPWTPAPLPDTGLARRRAILRALRVAAAGIAGLAAAGLLGWIVWNAAASDRTAGPAPASASRVAAAAPTAEPTLPETIVPTPSSAAAAGSGASASPLPTRPPATASATGSTEPPRAAEAPAPPQPRGLADGRTYIRVVELPEGGRIELGGIVWSEEEPRALLNDRIVAVDGYVEGFTVSKIDENRVVLVRDGMTIYLAVK